MSIKNSEYELNLVHLKEDPERLENLMIRQHAEYEGDPAIRNLLDSIYLEKDRASAFHRFFQSREFVAIQKLFSFFGVTTDKHLCEIGGGPGFLAWALRKVGFQRVDLVEPNSFYTTGTGYLKSRDDIAGITIFDNVAEWHDQGIPCDTVITKNCIHHFRNIAFVAACIRQKMKSGSLWFSFREWFADTPEELYAMITQHPYCQPYGLYEWPYPASHYVESIEIAGFKMIACVPYQYANNCLGTYSEEPIAPEVQVLTDQIDKILQHSPKQTVASFWQEIKSNKYDGTNLRAYSRPQVMVFQRA